LPELAGLEAIPAFPEEPALIGRLDTRELGDEPLLVAAGRVTGAVRGAISVRVRLPELTSAEGRLLAGAPVKTSLPEELLVVPVAAGREAVLPVTSGAAAPEVRERPWLATAGAADLVAAERE